MTENTEKALRILREAQPEVAPSVPYKLVEDIYGIETRLQFDEDRREAASKIHAAIEVSLEREFLKEVNDGGTL